MHGQYYFDTLLALQHLHPREFHEIHIAGLFRGKQLVAVGMNRRKTHPLQKRFSVNKDKIYLHAEFDAIWRGAVLLGAVGVSRLRLGVIRVTRSGELRPSKPCLGCLRAIEIFGIREVIHS